MKTYLLIYLLIIIFPFYPLYSNPSHSLSIKGTIFDYQSKQALPTASIILFEKNTNTFIKAGLTDEKGNFELNKISSGLYRLQIQYIGYNDYIIDSLVISESIQLPLIYLISIEQNLNEVNVIAIKPIIEQKANEMTINVSESSLATGGSVYDILQKTPGVGIQNESVTLRGKTLSLLIDGRLINLPPDEMMNIIKSLPASSVEKIELISNPTGKYDGQVEAILNIKTLKSKTDDWSSNLTIASGTGRKMRSNTSINLFYKKNKIALSTGWSYLNNSILRFINREFYISPSSSILFADERIENTQQYIHALKLDIDYSFHPFHSIGFAIRSSINPQKVFTTAPSTIREENKIEPDSIYNFSSITNGQFNTIAGNSYYKTTFDTLKNKELIINTDYYRYEKQWIGNYNSEIITYDSSAPKPNLLELNENPLQIDIKSATADYTHITKVGNWQTGIKTSWINIQNQSIWKKYEGNNWITNNILSDQFLYKENVQALYGGFTGNFKKINLELFLRIEHTQTQTNSILLEKEFTRRYTNFFPSINFEYHPSEEHEWTLSYQSNIQRPLYQDLNPFLRKRTAVTYIQGNPYLMPQINYNYSITYSYHHQLFLQVSTIQRKSMISELVRSDENLQALFFQKINYYNAIEPCISIIIDKSLTRWWHINLYGDVFTTVTNPAPSSTIIFSNTFSFSSSMALPKNWNIELAGRLDTPWGDGYYKHTIRYAMNIGIKKSFLDKKLNVSLLVNAADLPYWRRDTFLYTRYNATFSEDERYFMVSINYKLGNSKKNISVRKSYIDSEKNRTKE